MMTFESSFFEKKQVDWSRLEAYGFQKNNGVWQYRETFLDGDFEAQLEISSDGKVTGQIIDCDLEEPYTAYQVTSPVGAFVGQVREAYGDILKQVATACFREYLFASDQANRLGQWLLQTFGDQPDHPFKKIPEAVVFRSPANQKWYGLFMEVNRQKIDSKAVTSEKVVILNLKVNEKELAQLLSQSGFYPSYHMSKTNWVTVILDDKVPDQVVQGLLTMSRYLVSPKGYQSAPDEPAYWLVPANLKRYAIDLDFAENKVQIWPHKGQLMADDVMGIYITAPTKAMRYLCRVLEVFEQGDKKLMRISLEHIFPDHVFPMSRLTELGIKAVRSPRRMTPDLVETLKSQIES